MTTTAETSALPADPSSADLDVPSVTARHFGLAVLALAMGGFAIGTTEFVTMGLLPQISRASTSRSRPAATSSRRTPSGWSSARLCWPSSAPVSRGAASWWP